eukprot:3322806-Amphidinium_carterae.1
MLPVQAQYLQKLAEVTNEERQKEAEIRRMEQAQQQQVLQLLNAGSSENKNPPTPLNKSKLTVQTKMITLPFNWFPT